MPTESQSWHAPEDYGTPVDPSAIHNASHLLSTLKGLTAAHEQQVDMLADMRRLTQESDGDFYRRLVGQAIAVQASHWMRAVTVLSDARDKALGRAERTNEPGELPRIVTSLIESEAVPLGMSTDWQSLPGEMINGGRASTAGPAISITPASQGHAAFMTVLGLLMASQE